MDNTMEDLEIQLQELQSYRELDSEPFDFGTGLIYNDHSYGSEDAYYEMDIESLEEKLVWQHYCRNNIKIHKIKRYKRSNKYNRKKITQKHYAKIMKTTWFGVWYDEKTGRYIRCYCSNKRKLAHKLWVKKMRKNNDFKLKGNSCNKVYDYWWDIY